MPYAPCCAPAAADVGIKSVTSAWTAGGRARESVGRSRCSRSDLVVSQLFAPRLLTESVLLAETETVSRCPEGLSVLGGQPVQFSARLENCILLICWAGQWPDCHGPRVGLVCSVLWILDPSPGPALRGVQVFAAGCPMFQLQHRYHRSSTLSSSATPLRTASCSLLISSSVRLRSMER